MLADSLASDTSLVVANAAFFKGKWDFPSMDISLRLYELFYPQGAEDSPVNVEMMTTFDLFLYGDINELKCKAIALPFEVSISYS